MMPEPLAAIGRRARSRVGIETALLVALLAIAACLWIFLGLAHEVGEGELRHLDESILLALRVPGDLATPIGPYWLRSVARDITALGSTATLIVLVVIVAGFLLVAQMPRLAAFLVLSTSSGGLASQMLKRTYERPRPTLVPHGMEEVSASFPSGHAMGSALVYLTLAVLIASTLPTRALRLYVVCVAAAISLSIGVTRLYLGVHWPTDVAAGWAAGAGWSLACWAIARHWKLMERRD